MEKSEIRYAIKDLADELGVDIKGIYGLFSSYIEEMHGEIDSMQEFLQEKNWHMLQRVVHNIKGVSANLRVTDVFLEAEKFDTILKSNKIEDFNVCFNNLVQVISDAEKEISKYFRMQGLQI